MHQQQSTPVPQDTDLLAQQEAIIRGQAVGIVANAARLGMVLTIEQRALTPLAMGHHETVVSVRPARKAA